MLQSCCQSVRRRFVCRVPVSPCRPPRLKGRGKASTNPGAPHYHTLLSSTDLRRMHAILLGQLRQRHLLADRFERNLGLELWRMVLSFRTVSFIMRSTLTTGPKFRDHLWSRDGLFSVDRNRRGAIYSQYHQNDAYQYHGQGQDLPHRQPPIAKMQRVPDWVSATDELRIRLTE